MLILMYTTHILHICTHTLVHRITGTRIHSHIYMYTSDSKLIHLRILSKNHVFSLLRKLYIWTLLQFLKFIPSFYTLHCNVPSSVWAHLCSVQYSWLQVANPSKHLIKEAYCCFWKSAIGRKFGHLCWCIVECGADFRQMDNFSLIRLLLNFNGQVN